MIYRDSEIHGIFPTPVMKSQLDRALTSKEMAVFDAFAKNTRKNDGNTTSINNYVLEHDDLKDLKEFIQYYIDSFIQRIVMPKTNVNLYVTQSWVNYTKAGQYHHIHNHPNSVISGVFYINAVNDKIHFHNKKTPNYILDFETDNYELFNSKSWFFEVKTNDIFLFPSTLDHNVETLDGNREDVRISLAFNTFFKGFVGGEESLTALKL